ncbi:GntR family transcriptional regulator [Halioxenophilus sp. WMMB6]|uniref:GntR family transcriptional regulator n=1 Tax=Halioxenophilus sp. WMMB6 TaxID=3073815 RepID=UPI00295F233F|nr:GntR family transcriptional regulator [Halioxenophilus sp. WMMB6]
MQDSWNDQQPIYRQLRDRVAGQVLAGVFKEGEAVPSVRQVASEAQINHLTVGKAYQELVDEGVLEMKRGRGMFVVSGARRLLLNQEKQKFIAEELPAFAARLRQLDISIEYLLSLLKDEESK